MTGWLADLFTTARPHTPITKMRVFATRILSFSILSVLSLFWLVLCWFHGCVLLHSAYRPTCKIIIGRQQYPFIRSIIPSFCATINNESSRTQNINFIGQSYVLFHQLWKSGQEGDVTRVASGCADAAAEDHLRTAFAAQNQSLMRIGADGTTPRTTNSLFYLHITPDYSKTVIPGTDYKFFNKPHGLQHWMQHGLGMPQTLMDSKSNLRDTVFIILDPDQIILRPFTTGDFGLDPMSRWTTKVSTEKIAVGPRQPVGQLYGFGAKFMNRLNVDIPRIVKAAENVTANLLHKNGQQQSSLSNKRSPLFDWTGDQVEESYVVGPPYIAIGTDMYEIVTMWAGIVKPVYELTEDHLSEMFAYTTAAVQLQLPHHLNYNFMISETSTNWEGWANIDALEPEQVCQYVHSDASDPDNVAWRQKLPHIVHYCQRYFLGPYFFNKYKLPHSFLTCDFPLILDPTDDPDIIALKYSSAITPNNEFNELNPMQRKRHAFILCHIIARVNEAAAYWKQHNCPKENNSNNIAANFSKVYVVPFDKKK